MRARDSVATIPVLALAMLMAILVAPGHAVDAPNRDAYTPDVVVAQSQGSNAPRFPGIVELDDGRLLVVYRDGVDHTGQDGRILMVESADGGQTWSAPRVVVDGPADERDPKIMQTSDGTVFVSYFVLDFSVGDPYTKLGTFVVRSNDNGASWSEPVQIGTQMDGGTGSAAAHGDITELANGDLLAPLYGTPTGGTLQDATVVRSTDGGRTWPASSEVVIGAGAEAGFSFQEPVLGVVDSGEIVALLRTTSSPKLAYLSRSFDGGHTWTEPVATDMPASSHHVLVTDDGSVLVTYGDVSNRFGPRRETVGRLITDPAGSWNGYPDVLVYDSLTGDQANPDSVEVADGRYFTLGYNTDEGTLIGMFTEAADYADDQGSARLDLLSMYEAGDLTVDAYVYRDNLLGAIDGSLWYSANSGPGRDAPPDWPYTLTFARPQLVEDIGVALKPGYRESAVIEVSPDGTSWNQVGQLEATRTTGLRWLNVPGLRWAKAIRIVVTDSHGEWAQLTEVAVKRSARRNH